MESSASQRECLAGRQAGLVALVGDAALRPALAMLVLTGLLFCGGIDVTVLERLGVGIALEE